MRSSIVMIKNIFLLVLMIYTPLTSQFGLVHQSDEKLASLKSPALDFSSMEDAGVTAGTRLTLVCGVDEAYEWCTFVSPTGDVCDFKYKTSVWTGGNVVRLNCSLGGGATFKGNYQENQCGIELDIGVSDSGNWSCSIEEYRFGGSRGSGLVARGDIYIDVAAPSTTTDANIDVERRGKSLDMEDDSGVSEDDVEKMMGSGMKVAGSVVVAVGMLVIVLVAMVCHRTREKKVAVGSTVQEDKEKMEGENCLNEDRVNVEGELDQMKEYFPHVINFPDVNVTYGQQTPQLAEEVLEDLDDEDYMDMKIDAIPYPSCS